MRIQSDQTRFQKGVSFINKFFLIFLNRIFSLHNAQQHGNAVGRVVLVLLVVVLLVAGSVCRPLSRRRGHRGAGRLHIHDVPLRQMGKARRAVHRARAAVRQHGRHRHGPHAAGAVGARALRAFRRHAVFRDVRGARPGPGGPRPRAGARRHGQGLRVVPRPSRGPRVVQARQAVRPSGALAGRQMEVGPVQADAGVLGRQAQVDVRRHGRMRGAAGGPLGRADDAPQRYTRVERCRQTRRPLVISPRGNAVPTPRLGATVTKSKTMIRY